MLLNFPAAAAVNVYGGRSAMLAREDSMMFRPILTAGAATFAAVVLAAGPALGGTAQANSR